jgi:hypothetical protein
MFRSTTIIRELVLRLAEVMLEHSVKLRPYRLCGSVAACLGGACVLCVVCCVLCVVCCVLCAVCCVLGGVLCVVCCVLCAVCFVLCAVCCVLCDVCCVLCAVFTSKALAAVERSSFDF